MIFKSITVEHIGPFSTPTKIELEPDVTVFTGANDSGKSCALNAIRLLCERGQATESDINKDRFGKHRGQWNADKGIRVGAEIEVTETSVKQTMVSNLRSGDNVNFHYLANMPGTGYQIQSVQRGASGIQPRGTSIARLPKVVQLNPGAEIRSSMKLSALNPTEDQLLKLAFGSNFDASQLQALSYENRSQRLHFGGERLSQKLKDFFPKSLSFEIRFYEIGNNAQAIGVSLVDGVRGMTEVELRGSGIKRMLALMTLLLQEMDTSTHSILLLDEPESSLHADAQHQLRRVLEQLGSHQNIQVVYATHSPSMVNPAHPEHIRVFLRGLNGEFATSRIAKPAYGENFQSVRTSLGLTPADSLLYGLVTILVEGDTEARCLGPLLTKLGAANLRGFEHIGELLDACHIVCSGGDNVIHLCKLVSDQNAKPVVFLDGDKVSIARRLREARQDVAVVELSPGREFEDLVPKEQYISALTAQLNAHEVDTAQLTDDDFDAWWGEAQLPERMMFSKRVERWVQDRVGCSYNKHAVMEAAIAATPVDEIDSEALLLLLEAVRDRLL
jgi:predicted ATP-dependent endonuclease of OLD family